MADLRKAARGRECQVRIPGVCNGNPETSVLAHIRLTGLCGTGTKPPDLIATIACSACHDEIDRRTHFVDVGYPYQMNQDESVRLLAHVVSKYIVRLAKVPQSSVDQMSPADLNAAAWLVAGFFLQA